MRPRAKYAVIHRHRSEYSVSTMCRFFGVSRSGYYDFVRRIGKPEKDAELAAAIRQQQEKSFNTYGYRRMCLALKSKGIHCNPKTILRVMKKYDLLSEIRRRRKWVNMGQQLHRYENLLNRQFHADKPNRKWVTDISYIHTKQGILYLSMIRDLYHRLTRADTVLPDRNAPILRHVPWKYGKYSLRVLPCLDTFLCGKTASHLPAMDFRGIFGFRATGGLAPAKARRTKSTAKARWQACLPLLIDGMITALSLIRLVQNKRLTLYWTRSVLLCAKRKRGPLRSCTSTATRAFNIHPTHISS